MELIGELHGPAALPPGYEVPVPTGREAGWAPEPDWTRWRIEKNPCPCQESNPGLPVRCLVTIMTGLRQLSTRQDA